GFFCGAGLWRLQSGSHPARRLSLPPEPRRHGPSALDQKCPQTGQHSLAFPFCRNHVLRQHRRGNVSTRLRRLPPASDLLTLCSSPPVIRRKPIHRAPIASTSPQRPVAPAISAQCPTSILRCPLPSRQKQQKNQVQDGPLTL